MLVLKRYLGESIVIGANVEVSVVKLHSQCPYCHRQHNNGSVRLGVTAPRDVVVDRKEVHERRVANAETVRDRCVQVDPGWRDLG